MAAKNWLDSPQAAPYRDQIISVGQSRGVDPHLIANQIGAESAFNPNAVSRTGAVGLAQILPSTARDPGYGLSSVNPRDPNQSIAFAADYTIARGGYNDRGLTNYSGGDYSSGVKSNILTGGLGSPVQSQSTNGVFASSDGTVAQAGKTITTDAGDGTIVSQTDNSDGTSDVVLGGSNPSDTATSATGGGTGTATQGSGQTAPAGAQQGGAGTSQSAGFGSGGSGFGAYLNEVARAIANQLSPSTEKAGQTVASATTQSGQTIAKGSTDAAQIAAAQSKATDTLFSDLSKDYFGRAIVVILGIVFVAGGVAMFVYNRNPVALAKDALT